MAKAWAKFPYPDKSFHYTAATLKKSWDRLHKGDAEPFPKNDDVVEAWIAFHAGDFQKAAQLGIEAGDDGITVANKAQAIYANYLEERREAQARTLRGSRAARREAAGQAAEERQRLLLAGVRARPVRAGHLGGQGPGAGHRRQGEGRAGGHDQARAEARRRAHRARARITRR